MVYCFSALLTSCVIEYDVEVFNHTTDAVQLRMVQYHSPEFDGTPPREFSDSLVVERRDVRVPAHGKSTVVFDSGAGGFWLRWKVLNHSGTAVKWSTVDSSVRNIPLISDSRIGTP
jgi:hypothetical protein